MPAKAKLLRLIREEVAPGIPAVLHDTGEMPTLVLAPGEGTKTVLALKKASAARRSRQPGT